MKGFFSFILLFLMAVIILEYSLFFVSQENNFLETKIELIALETSNKDRTILENNVDRLIFNTLNNELDKTTNLIIIQNSVNLKLLNFLDGKVIAKVKKVKKNLNLSFLNNSSSVISFETQKIKYAEYVFTHGPLLNNSISKTLGNEMKTNFTIPVYYTQRVIK